jgi:hypothetical protein
MSWRRRAVLAAALVFVAFVVWRFSAVMMRRAAVRALEDSGWTVVLEDPPADSPTILDRLAEHLGQSGTIVSGMLGREPEVVEVRIAEMETPADSEADLSLLGRLPHLQRLSLQREALSPSDVSAIGGIEGLRELSIASDSLTDQSLARLADLSHLQSLTIVSQRVSDAGLSHLTGITTLRSLDLQSTRAGGGGVDAFGQLESLALGPMTGDADLEAVARLPQLNVLILTDSRISDDGFRRLGSLPALETLILSGPHSVTDEGLQVLADLDQLKRITLHGQRYTWAGLKPLSGLPQLEQVELRGGGLGDAGLDSFVPPGSLTVLRLHYTSISEEGFDRFESRYPKIELWR